MVIEWLPYPPLLPLTLLYIVFLASPAETAREEGNRYITIQASAEALLRWKATLSSYPAQPANSSLCSWKNSAELNTTSSPCMWYGVHCNPEATAVVGIDLPGMNLNGTLSGLDFSSFPRLSLINLSANHLQALMQQTDTREEHDEQYKIYMETLFRNYRMGREPQRKKKFYSIFGVSRLYIFSIIFLSIMIAYITCVLESIYRPVIPIWLSEKETS